MGVTIHFEGSLQSEENFTEVIRLAEAFANSHNWHSETFINEYKVLQRVMEDEDDDWQYEGPTKGINIQIEPDCDPLRLEFDGDLYIQDFCKTQFTDLEVHIAIIGFFRQIEPYFDTLIVDDEGEYWDTDDQHVLQKNIESCFKAIEDAKKEDSSLRGPLRLENGRMIDLIS